MHNDQPTHVITANGFTARKAQDDLAWGEGAIQPQSQHSSDADQQALIEVVLASIQPVADAERAYSACTDGRIPIRLLSGESIPVREQMVGADIVSAFCVAEVLGDRFYADKTVPVTERILAVAEFLKKNNLMPSSHVACGAAAGFVTILQNMLRFADDARFVARLQELLPQTVFDATVYAQVQEVAKARLSQNAYEGLEAQAFLDAATKVSGERAIAELKDDGRGVHGHVEEQIVRVRVPGKAINEGNVAELTGGREVFGVNDGRIASLARLFAADDERAYQMAHLALEMFANAGHGTLAKNLPTWIVEAA